MTKLKLCRDTFLAIKIIIYVCEASGVYQAFITVHLGITGHTEHVQFIYVKKDMVKYSQVEKEKLTVTYITDVYTYMVYIHACTHVIYSVASFICEFSTIHY